MSRILPGNFRENGAAVVRPLHALTLLDALDLLTPEQRETITGLTLAFAGAARKPRKGANHRTRELLAFLMSPAALTDDGELMRGEAAANGLALVDVAL